MITRPTLLIATLALGFFIAGNARADVYDANLDFVPNLGNPNGVWSYGTSASLPSAFITFPEYVSSPAYFGWQLSGTGVIWKNTTGGNYFGIPDGSLALHPGPAGDFSILRFLAPTAGSYNLSIDYLAGDTGDTDLRVIKNRNLSGESLLYFDSSVNTDIATENSFTLNGLGLAAGDTVELLVGFGPDNNFSSDNTPINMVLTTAVPEPGVAALAGLLGTLWCAATVRRRRIRGAE